MGLEEFGLKAKLKSLVALLQENNLDITINLTVDDALPSCDETSNLTIYRVVQEGVTNAFKHANACVIDIGVVPGGKPVPGDGNDPSRPVVRVSVSDDGRGLPDALRPSYGIAGMSERVRATGGEIKLTQSSVNLEDLIGRYIFSSQGGQSGGTSAEGTQ